MPELPDLEYIVSVLDQAVRGRRIHQVRIKNPIVLRLAVRGTLEDICLGQAFGRCWRHGHFVVLEIGEAHELIVNPMLAGRFRLCSEEEKAERSLCLAFGLPGQELRYLDDKQMGKVYLVPSGDRQVVPGFEKVGLEPLSPNFVLERLREIIRPRRDQVRTFLLDKTAVAAIGNAYADEILWAAHLHPKTGCQGLADEDIAGLYGAIRDVLEAAVREVARRKEPIDVKVRDFLRVRNRKGLPCPVCGTAVRVEGVRGHDAFYCPTCQPNRPEARLGRRQLVDWTRLPTREK
ncbi:MAG TPA: DNA-formamidopyrimidine glycosylase family protein [Candidatus Methylomirabilis sp.]|nr:DNA-formamidopyrimidine glycosylase family protein [Candidatus Methylomirabilis sp.]